LHLIVINIVDINTEVNFLNHSIASVRKELRPYRNALMTPDCHLSAEYECCVSQRSVKTLIRWGGKRLHHIMPNLIRKICTKPYQNRSRFVKDMTKRFWCVFWLAVPTVVHLQNVDTLFRWSGKRLYFCTTNLLRTICAKFYHNRLSFVEDMTENILVFFSVHSVCYVLFHTVSKLSWLTGQITTFDRGCPINSLIRDEPLNSGQGNLA